MPLAQGLRASRRAGLPVLLWPGLEGLGVQAILTTRAGGVSGGPYASLNLGLHVGDDAEAVMENRRRAARALGAGLDDLVFCGQVHGASAALVAAPERGRGARLLGDALPGVDALVTTTPGLGLVIMVADCVPVLLLDPRARVLACAHAGWRGTTGRVLEAAVSAMLGLGASLDRMVAAIGPAVAPEDYEVGPEVTGAVRRCFGEDLDGLLCRRSDGGVELDLSAANRRILLQAGLREEGVLLTRLSTADRRLYSHRRQRPCGRFALLARIEESPGPRAH